MRSPFRIFYDGLEIEKYAGHPKIAGFTTNCSIFGKCSLKSYREFWEAHKERVGDRPFSLQIWKDDVGECIEQIRQIHAIDARIYVKVPIVNTRGEYNEAAIRVAVASKIRLNITAIHSLEQIQRAAEFLEGSEVPEIVSIFGGPISDRLEDPGRYVSLARELFEGRTHTQILWAGCRELYTIKRAEEYGCDCITIPDAMMERLPLAEKSADELTLDRVKLFQRDAEAGGFTIL